MKTKHIWVAGMVFVGLCAVTMRADAPDPALPAYEPGPPLQGKLSTKGADGLAQVMKLWIAMFQKVQPGIQWHFETGAPTTSPHRSQQQDERHHLQHLSDRTHHGLPGWLASPRGADTAKSWSPCRLTASGSDRARATRLGQIDGELERL